MSQLDEPSYIVGKRTALVGLLRHVLNELDYLDPVSQGARWIIEREETVTALRSICADHGDNEWPSDLHLADVIEKHLARHLDNDE